MIKEANIEKIQPNDVGVIRELFKIYERQLGVNLCFQDFETELQALPGIYAEPRGTILKAVIDKQIVGCVALKPLDETTCEMKRLFVLDDFKGKGIGKQLAERIISVAKEKQYALMKLDTLKRLKAAVSLYDSLGFSHTKPYNYNPESDILYFELSLKK